MGKRLPPDSPPPLTRLSEVAASLSQVGVQGFAVRHRREISQPSLFLGEVYEGARVDRWNAQPRSRQVNRSRGEETFASEKGERNPTQSKTRSSFGVDNKWTLWVGYFLVHHSMGADADDSDVGHSVLTVSFD